MEGAQVCDLSREGIDRMDAGTLIEALLDVFDLEPSLRAMTMAFMRLRAKEIGIEDVFLDTAKEYDLLGKKNDMAYRREMARKNNPVPLELDIRGNALPSIENFLKVMRNDSYFHDIYYNELKNSPEIHKDGKILPWTDTDDADMRRVIEREYKIHNEKKTQDAFLQLMRERAYHPIRDLIDGFTWDGEERLEGFLVKWMKCDDTPYTREATRLIFAGGIHRLYSPGCKFDDMVVLIGTKQGEGKSTMVRWLALEDDFFREVNEFEGVKGIEAIEGAWICEVSEMLAVTKSKEQEAVKGYLTRLVDSRRKVWHRHVSKEPRQCIFVGTTNKVQFLADKTGGRRFYPLHVNSIGYDLFDNEEAIKADIVQCWAEARYKMKKGKMPCFANRELKASIQEAQGEAQEDDYRIGLIEKYLEDKKEVCGLELWEEALRGQYREPTKKDFMDIGLIMQGLEGWERAKNQKRLEKYGKQKLWVRNAGSENEQVFLQIEGDVDFPF